MTSQLVIQTGERSLVSMSACTSSAEVPAPEALSSGDTFVVIVTTDGSVEPTAADDSWRQVVEQRSGLTVAMFYRYVWTDGQADALRASGLTVNFGDDPQCSNFFSLRITGADPNWLIEAHAVAEGTLADDGHLIVPSLDPAHRHSNVLLFAGAAEYDVHEGQVRMIATGAAPLASTVQPPPVEDRSDALMTALFARPLQSAEPTGETEVAVSGFPMRAAAVVFMLRSRNTPPVLSLPERWVAEIGRAATVTATVTDPDQTAVSVGWSQVSGPVQLALSGGTTRSVTFVPEEPGIYTLEAVAVDVDGGRTVARTDVVVPTGRSAPQWVAASDGWIDDHGAEVTVVALGDSNDSTFARTEGLPAGKPLTLTLPPLYGGAAVSVIIRGAATNPSPPLTRTVTLRQDDGQVIAERSYPLSTQMQTYILETTRAETAHITSRSAMTVTIVDEVA